MAHLIILIKWILKCSFVAGTVYHYSYFTDNETEARRGKSLAQGHTARNAKLWFSWRQPGSETTPLHKAILAILSFNQTCRCVFLFPLSLQFQQYTAIELSNFVSFLYSFGLFLSIFLLNPFVGWSTPISTSYWYRIHHRNLILDDVFIICSCFFHFSWDSWGSKMVISLCIWQMCLSHQWFWLVWATS